MKTYFIVSRTHEVFSWALDTKPEKCRRKGILRACECSQTSTNIGSANELLADFKLCKDQK